MGVVLVMPRRVQMRFGDDAINHVDAEPEQRLAAAVLRAALQAGQRGDARARRWFHSEDAMFWLVLVTPEGVSPEWLRQQFVEQMGVRRVRRELEAA